MSGVTDADIFDFTFDYTKEYLFEMLMSEWVDIKPVSVKKMNIFGEQFKVPKLRVRRVKKDGEKLKIGTFYIKELTDERSGKTSVIA